MINQFFTLFRGAVNSTTEEFTNQHALLILQQQMRDCAQAVTTARKAVAIAMAQNQQEIEQHKNLVGRIAELEARATSALQQKKSGLAREAAECIVEMEAERDASSIAQKQFSSEINRLKATVRVSETKLRELQRGQRLATANDKAQKLRDQTPASANSTLRDAEATLVKLQQRQKQMDLTAVASAEMEQSAKPASISQKLAEAGCGTPIHSNADDVLARLSNKVLKK